MSSSVKDSKSSNNPSSGSNHRGTSNNNHSTSIHHSTSSSNNNNGNGQSSGNSSNNIGNVYNPNRDTAATTTSSSSSFQGNFRRGAKAYSAAAVKFDVEANRERERGCASSSERDSAVVVWKRGPDNRSNRACRKACMYRGTDVILEFHDSKYVEKAEWGKSASLYCCVCVYG